MTSSAILSLLFLCLGLVSAQAQGAGKYHITPDEQAACQGDAMALCSSAYPDEDALLACMRSDVDHIGPVCRKTFVAGLQRRRL